MESKDVQMLLDKVKEQFDNAATKTTLELKEMKEDILKEAKETLGKDSDHLKAIQEQLDNMETSIKKQRDGNKKEVSFKESIESALNSDEFKKQIENDSVNYRFKAISNKAISNSSMTAGLNEVNLPFREIGIDKAQVRPLLVSQIIQWGTTNSPTVDWVERTTKTNNADTRAEAAAMGEGALAYTERYVKVKIVSELMKVTKEALKDTSFLASEINSELLSDVSLALDDQILSGDNTGNNMKGITEYAQAFAAGTFAATVDQPNEFDVLRVAYNQIFVAGKGKFMPNYILLHPTDATKMDLTKDPTTGNYIIPPFYSSDGMRVNGVPVIVNTGITAGTYLIGDFMRAKGFIRDGLEIKVWDQDEDNAQKNLATITCNVRAAFRIKNQDAYAFVNGTFATDIAALQKP